VVGRLIHFFHRQFDEATGFDCCRKCRTKVFDDLDEFGDPSAVVTDVVNCVRVVARFDEFKVLRIGHYGIKRDQLGNENGVKSLNKVNQFIPGPLTYITSYWKADS
jgi:hypothetical protein